MLSKELIASIRKIVSNWLIIALALLIEVIYSFLPETWIQSWKLFKLEVLKNQIRSFIT